MQNVSSLLSLGDTVTWHDQMVSCGSCDEYCLPVELTFSLTHSLLPPSPDLVLWCLHAGPSAEGHLASLPQLNQTYYPNQIKKVAPFDYCLANVFTPIGEFHVGSVWLS